MIRPNFVRNLLPKLSLWFRRYNLSSITPRRVSTTKKERAHRPSHILPKTLVLPLHTGEIESKTAKHSCASTWCLPYTIHLLNNPSMAKYEAKTYPPRSKHLTSFKAPKMYVGTNDIPSQPLLPNLHPSPLLRTNNDDWTDDSLAQGKCSYHSNFLWAPW